MVVGAALVELRVHGSQSLKQKRGVLRSIAGRLRNRFNVSVAEVGGQDTWQRAVLGRAIAGTEEAAVRRRLQRMLEAVEEMHLAEVTGFDLEVLLLPFEVTELGDEESDPP